ncbi:glutathione-disulfide reductase [Paraburkholderia humisilvae]|uniref:Glutathione amide reductase n=1 Tax=Paraburkholderia humisilvae TaxID=627669 RepID=A0A6J5F6G9_9BURK|nr:glutathione-disulfide reductase [Paraburkholderia humisilvae]CAB3773192.1 Glutathione amide reductase [Paraburkholderia humisilvae]
MKTFDVDLFVIGAGSGGVRAARVAASHGARVAIAERSRVGGTCVVRGCVPKKLFVYASRVNQVLSDAAAFGWQLGESRFDWPTLLGNKNVEIARLEGLYRSGLAQAGVALVEGHATIDGPNTILIRGTLERIRAKRILVATGGSPNRDLDIPGIGYAIDSNDVFELGNLPPRALIIGGGYIAIEFAGLLHGLGVKTSLVHRGAKLLRGFDSDIQIELERAYRRRGIDLRLAETVSRIDRADDVLRVALSSGLCVDVEAVILAAGRRPNTRDLGLEAIGVKLGSTGAIIVDATGQSSVPWLYAVGDVTNRVNLTPVAIREGQAFADRVFGKEHSRFNYRNIPTAIFSTPEVAVVGMSESEARLLCPELEIFRSSFTSLTSAMNPGTPRVNIKLLVDRTNDRVLGAQAIGEGAAEMIQLIAVALSAGVTKHDFDRTVALHPTIAEEWTTMHVSEKYSSTSV